MSFREELANIMTESMLLVYTEKELDRIQIRIEADCINAAKKGFDHCTILNTVFFAMREGRNIYPSGDHEQIVEIFRKLDLDASYMGSLYIISWDQKK